jgi:hypothetical protein
MAPGSSLNILYSEEDAANLRVLISSSVWVGIRELRRGGSRWRVQQNSY